jgi:hypothetical protein
MRFHLAATIVGAAAAFMSPGAHPETPADAPTPVILAVTSPPPTPSDDGDTTTAVESPAPPDSAARSDDADALSTTPSGELPPPPDPDAGPDDAGAISTAPALAPSLSEPPVDDAASALAPVADVPMPTTTADDSTSGSRAEPATGPDAPDAMTEVLASNTPAAAPPAFAVDDLITVEVFECSVTVRVTQDAAAVPAGSTLIIDDSWGFHENTLVVAGGAVGWTLGVVVEIQPAIPYTVDATLTHQGSALDTVHLEPDITECLYVNGVPTTDPPTPEPTDLPAPEPTDPPTPESTDPPTPERTDAPAPDPTDPPAPDLTDPPAPESTDSPAPTSSPTDLPPFEADATPHSTAPAGQLPSTGSGTTLAPIATVALVIGGVLVRLGGRRRTSP